MYISIPEGMIFQQIRSVKLDSQGQSHTLIRDCFVSPVTEQIIELQALVKDALRDNARGNKCIVLKEFTIYLKTPPNTQDSYLVYTPKNNGKLASEVEPEIIVGSKEQRINPSLSSRYGEFWSQHAEFDEATKERIRDRRQSQKENRRHYGDSPMAT